MESPFFGFYVLREKRSGPTCCLELVLLFTKNSGNTSVSSRIVLVLWPNSSCLELQCKSTLTAQVSQHAASNGHLSIKPSQTCSIYFGVWLTLCWCASVLIFKSISFKVDQLVNFHYGSLHKVMERMSMVILTVSAKSTGWQETVLYGLF